MGLITVLSNTTIKLLYSVGTQQIVYQSVKLVTCFSSLSHHQANSQTILKVHSVRVHIVGSEMFTNRVAIKCTNDSLGVPSLLCILQLTRQIHIK
jgi:hypothetical protein